MKTLASIMVWLGLLFIEPGFPESAPPADAPIEIEGWEKASDKAQSALKAYYEARRQHAQPVAGMVGSSTAGKRAPLAPKRSLAPGEEQPERVSLTALEELRKKMGENLPEGLDVGSLVLDEEELVEEAPVEKKQEVDSTDYRELSQTRGYFINRGGGLRYFSRGSETFGEGYLDAKRIRRSDYDRLAPYRGPERMQERRSTYRDHLSRTGRMNRTRNPYR